MKKIRVVLISLIFTIAAIGAVYGAAGDGYTEGDIGDNPWADLFTTASTETTPEVTTPEPTTPEPTTPEPTTSESTTPEPTTPESTTPEPTTPESTTPEPTTPIVELQIVEQPQDVSAKVGDVVNFAVKATGEGLKYQWQMSNDGGKTWTNSTATGSGPDNINVVVRDVMNGRQYRCVVTDESGNKVESNGAKITIGNGDLQIVTQPQDVNAKAGDVVNFAIKATGKGLKYQWQMSNDGGKTWTNSTAKGSAPDNINVAVRDAMNGRQYRCVVTDESGNKVESNGAKITIGSGNLQIVTQPQDVKAKAGDVVNFAIKVTGEGLKYQWQMSDDGGKTWTNSTAKGSAPDNINVAVRDAMNGRQYRCVVTDESGNKVESNGAKITIGSGNLQIVTQPQDVKAKAGDVVNFAIKATGEGLKYQWQMSDDGGKTWTNSTAKGSAPDNINVVVRDAMNGRQYRCVVTDADGNSVTSMGALVTVE